MIGPTKFNVDQCEQGVIDAKTRCVICVGCVGIRAVVTSIRGTWASLASRLEKLKPFNISVEANRSEKKQKAKGQTSPKRKNNKQ